MIFRLKKEEWEERWEREFQMPYKNRDRLCYNENRREIRKLKKTFGKMPLWFQLKKSKAGEYVVNQTGDTRFLFYDKGAGYQPLLWPRKKWKL